MALSKSWFVFNLPSTMPYYRTLCMAAAIPLISNGAAPTRSSRPTSQYLESLRTSSGFLLKQRQRWPLPADLRFHSTEATTTQLTMEETAARQPSQKVTVVKKTDDQLLQELKKLIKTRKVVLFMKGSPEDPQCGFSRRSVQILMQTGCSDFTYVDVLRSERIRDIIKKHAGWPTIPQLFVGGEFVGGCDVMTELFTSGELRKLLEKHGVVFEETEKNEQEETKAE